MRIVIDMQGAQTASRFRGIGRYTMAIAKAIVRNCESHEVILVLNGLFDQSIATIRREFSGQLPEENILVWVAPGPVNVSDPKNQWREEVAQQLRQAFLLSLQPDVIYLSSLFEGFADNAITSVAGLGEKILVCSTVYDFIPLLKPEQYLTSNPAYARYYGRKIEEIKKSGLFLAISESSRREAIEHLGVKSQSVVNMAAACDDIFTTRVIDEPSRLALMRKWGLDRPFILYTGGADDRKNLPRLLEAFAALPAQTRSKYQLLFAGKLSNVEVDHLRSTAKQQGLSPEELRLTGFVSDDELVMAYNLCHLFVFPSWHEGFGLPPLEAMTCGAPVIAANTSSLPEVVGLDLALFDPFSVESIQEKMHQALTDSAYRELLIDHGRRQAQKFSWNASGRIAIQAFERARREREDALQALRPWQEEEPTCYAEHVKSLARILKILAVTADSEVSAVASCLAHNETVARSRLRQGLLPTAIDWRLEGPFDSSYSLALVNRELARALELLGHRVALHSSEGPGDFTPDASFLQANLDLKMMYQRCVEMPAAQAHVLSRFMYPPRVEDMTGRFNALHCYGWEESQFPSAWVDAFNQYLDGITVMSSHVEKVLIDSGVRVPIANTGLGVDHWERVQPDPEFRLDFKKFRFLHVSSCFPRKGVEAMLQAYGHAFRKQDDVTLIIKTFENPHNEVHRWSENARAGDENYPDVQILMGDYSDAQLKSLYQQCHALVAPSKAEGFGLPLAEAMLSGLAVITTGWSGQLDFCTNETAWLVDYEFVRAESHFGLSESVWAEPNVQHLARTMREVCDASKDARQQRANLGRQKLLSAFTWQQVAHRTVHAVRSRSGQCPPVKPRIGWVTSWNTRCGIASYSEHLLRGMSQDIRVFASRTQFLNQDDDARVNRCWTQGDEDELKDLRAAIEAASIDVLVVQFNYGFFDFSRLPLFLQSQLDAGKKVVVELHSTTDPVQASYKKLADLLPVLQRCARVLVHSPADMNRLKQLGLVSNVTLFPLGVLQGAPAAKKVSNTPQFVLASYGFFLPHKGLLELIRALVILKSQGIPIALKMINAEYPAAPSREAIEQARLEIESAQMQGCIELITEYQDDTESLRQLAEADLIVFPYQNTGESSSAAVRHGIASGRPVAVTPLEIFDDVRHAVHQLPGTSTKQIAQGIHDLMLKIQANETSVVAKSRMAASWHAEHTYCRLAGRLENILTALHGQ